MDIQRKKKKEKLQNRNLNESYKNRVLYYIKLDDEELRRRRKRESEREREGGREVENRYTRWKKLSDWCDTGSPRRNLKRCVFKMKEERNERW